MREPRGENGTFGNLSYIIQHIQYTYDRYFSIFFLAERGALRRGACANHQRVRVQHDARRSCDDWASLTSN